MCYCKTQLGVEDVNKIQQNCSGGSSRTDRNLQTIVFRRLGHPQKSLALGYCEASLCLIREFYFNHI